MIITSGKLEYRARDGREYDDNGYPMQQTTVWSPAVPCQVVPLQYDRTVLSSTTETPVIIARYEVLINARHYKEADEVRITDTRSGRTEELRVVSAEYLRAVSQYKLLCR